MYNNNLDTLDASDQMMLPHIKLPLWFVRKKSTHPYQPSLCAPNPPKKQKKKDKNDPVTLTKLIEWVGLSTIDCLYPFLLRISKQMTPLHKY